MKGSATAAPEAASFAVARRNPAATGDAVKSPLEWKLLASAQGGRRDGDDDDASEHEPTLNSSTSTSATVAAARCAVEAYARLPPRGKPNQGEHTVMASFVVEEEEPLPPPSSSSSSPALQPNNSSSAFTAVAVATGSKCVGAAARSRRGDVVNDCHAEVLARRALLRWMVAEMEKAKAEGGEGGDGERGKGAGSRFFERDNSNAASSSSSLSSSSSSALPRFRKKTPWRLHLVTSQVPCGDACVRPGAVTGARAMMMTGGRRRGAGGEGEGDEERNLTQPSPPPPPPPEGLIDVRDQRPGIARRKPGRGDSTLSMSCSDKIARWGCLGVQGSLLSTVLVGSEGDREGKGEGGAIFIDEVTVVVAAAAATEEETEGERDDDAARQTVLALRRALAGRTRPLRACLEGPFRWSPPRRLSVVSVAWRRKEDEEMEARRDESHPFTASSRNPLDDLGLDTSAGGSATAAEEEHKEKAKNFPSSSARRTPSGLALAWSAVRERNGSGNFEKAEVLLGAYGCLAGFNRKAEKKKKRKKEEDGEEAGAKEEQEEERRRRIKIHHRPPLPQLSKRAALARFFELVGGAEEGSGSRRRTYREAKEGAVAYRRSWRRMLGFKEEEAAAAGAAATTGVAARCLSSPPLPPQPPPLQGWLAKPRDLEEFALVSD